MARTTADKPESEPISRPPSGRTRDRRVERSRHAVLSPAFELLYECGVGGFSIDKVARRSGVAKTTIYRHWPSREALVIDACRQLTAQPDIPDTGSLRGDLTAVLTEIAHQLQTANWSSVLPSILDVLSANKSSPTSTARSNTDTPGPCETCSTTRSTEAS